MNIMEKIKLLKSLIKERDELIIKLSGDLDNITKANYQLRLINLRLVISQLNSELFD